MKLCYAGMVGILVIKVLMGSSAKWRLCSWLYACKDFKDFKAGDLFLSWEGCLKSMPRKRKPQVKWSPPPSGTQKFNVDGAPRGKPKPAGIRGVLRDHSASTSIVFSESVGIKDSNETKLFSIRRALSLELGVGGDKLVIKSNSSNAIK